MSLKDLLFGALFTVGVFTAVNYVHNNYNLSWNTSGITATHKRISDTKLNYGFKNKKFSAERIFNNKYVPITVSASYIPSKKYLDTIVDSQIVKIENDMNFNKRLGLIDLYNPQLGSIYNRLYSY